MKAVVYGWHRCLFATSAFSTSSKHLKPHKSLTQFASNIPPQVPTCYEHSIIPLSGGNTHLARKTQYLLKFKTHSQIMNRQIESAGSYLQSVKSSVFGWVFPCSCGCGVTMELGIYCHLADVFLPRRLGAVWVQRFYSRLSRTPPLKRCTSCFSPNQEINKSVVWFN